MSIKQAIEALEKAQTLADKSDKLDRSRLLGNAVIKHYDTILTALRSMPQGEPVAWVRFCGDGLYEGPVMNCDKTRMENVRHKISEWTPLCAANVPETNFGNTQPTEAVRMSEADLGDLQGATFAALVRKGYSGGMGSEQWDEAHARAVEQATAARLGVKMGDV